MASQELARPPMHGTILAELEKFVSETYGGSAWSDLKKGAGIERERYDVMTDYPDSEVVALVAAASTMTGVAIPALLALSAVVHCPYPAYCLDRFRDSRSGGSTADGGRTGRAGRSAG